MGYERQKISVENLRFYHLLLCAVCESGSDSFSIGDSYHKAFGRAVEETPAGGINIEAYLDPVFGRYPEAEEMLLLGLQRFMLATDSQGSRAYFRISSDDGRNELDRANNTDDYRSLARVFLDELAG